MLMTVIMYDVEKGLTKPEQEVVERSKLHKQVSGKLFYADDTIIMAKELRRQLRSYYIELRKITQVCAETQPKQAHPMLMNAIHRMHFGQGNAVPIQTQADYLGGKIKNTGDHKPEVQHTKTATWTTVRPLDLPWEKSRASIKWKLRVYDAVIVAKLMYGLSSIPL